MINATRYVKLNYDLETTLQMPRYAVTGSKVDTKSAPVTALRMPKVGLLASPKVIVSSVVSP
jgi:hypothetical protein